jgi:hypothetical protein
MNKKTQRIALTEIPMSEESSISKEPLAPAPRPDGPDLPPMPLLVQRPAPIWTPGQLAFLAGQFTVLVAVYMFLRATNWAYLQILFTHPVGIKMLIIAVVMMLINAALYLGLTFALNQALLRGEGRRKTHAVLAVLLACVHLILFFIPALYVLLAGPAAIQIMENMASQP